MPPRIRTRATKVLKENIDVVKKSRVKSDGKITKPSRKALADKTNSLSDDNASIDLPVKTPKKTLNSKNTKPKEDDEVRHRRQRKLPSRYIENQTLKNLSNSKGLLVKQSSVTSKTKTTTKITPVKEIPIKTTEVVKGLIKQRTNIESSSKVPNNKIVSKSGKSTKNADNQESITKFLTKSETHPVRNCRTQSTVEKSPKDSVNVSSPFKTPSKDTENSLLANRPKRVCRLPSRFEDHSISPNKFIAVQPCHASTPIPQKTTKVVSKTTENVSVEEGNDAITKHNKMTRKLIPRAIKSKIANNTNSSNSSIDKISPDTNNNGKKILKSKRATVKKQVSPDNKIKPFAKRLLDKSSSFRVLEDRKSSENGLDVYEFTFDPNEEPQQKKKRKKPVRKRPAKPKTVVKSNYNDNVSKALAKLKCKVKPSQTKHVQSNVKPMENLARPIEDQAIPTENQVMPTGNHVTPTENVIPSVAKNVQSSQPIAKQTTENIPQSNYSAHLIPLMPETNESVNLIHASNHASIRVEDIAADFEFSDHNNDINYSPVNSPHHDPIPKHHETIPEVPEANKSIAPVNNKDPLNLQDVSFFEEPPVASSSMNISARHPLASPWRVEFGSLPMKWHNNTYVKPNMTPAVESSFVNSEVTKKKHIYTNMVPEQEPLPEVFENAAPALKQTSIILFMKEVAERNANKKKRRRSQTSRPIFDDITGNSNEAYKSPKKAKITKDFTPNTSINTNTSKDQESSSNISHKTLSPDKKKNSKDCTYFGFDETENIDQENVSPVKVNPNPKTRVLRSRNVLQELNTQPMPTRAAKPVSAKAKMTSSEVVEQLYDQLKSAENAQLPVNENAKELGDNTGATNVDDLSLCEDNEDSQSVHLFEDIEVVHHLKVNMMLKNL